jgi:superfamily II RNA helicase
METFRGRCTILEKLGYLTPEYRFNNGANIVKHLHIQELLVAELILDGVLDDLDVYHLSALLCCIGQSDKRRGDARPPMVPLDRALVRRIRNILRKIRDAGAERVESIELNFDYAIVGLMWCQGADFSELLSISNLDEGDIISCFRQTIDLIKQLKDVYQADQKMIQHLNVCIDIMDRDVVRVVL